MLPDTGNIPSSGAARSRPATALPAKDATGKITWAEINSGLTLRYPPAHAHLTLILPAYTIPCCTKLSLCGGFYNKKQN